MPLSISNFERGVPNQPWLKILVVALIMPVLMVMLLEYTLVKKGFQATVLDSAALWIEQRVRASTLGNRALILVGASRIQLGLDLSVLRDGLALEPVQLAVDGSSFFSVLEGLARDPSFRGTVIVDYADHVIQQGLVKDYAAGLQRAYEKRDKTAGGLAARAENILESIVRHHLRSYADGARPMTSLFERALRDGSTQQYLVTFPDRTRNADYTKVSMPDFYYSRVFRHSGLKPSLNEPVTTTQIDRFLYEAISQFGPADNRSFLENLTLLKVWVERIRQRGGDVIFLRMPVSGFVQMIDNQRYPRADFFDQVTSLTGAASIHFADFPEMGDFHCPDGSHLDYRDKKPFTKALVQELKRILQAKYFHENREYVGT